jgi:hypothetical protein
MFCEVGLAANVGRINCAEESEESDAQCGEVIGGGRFQHLNGFSGRPAVQRGQRAKRRQVAESYRGVFWEPLFESLRQSFRLCKIASITQTRLDSIHGPYAIYPTAD